VGWPRSFPIVQFPNAPLLVAFAGWGLAALTDGTAHDFGRSVFVVGLGVWALLELESGVNWFRRLVGAGTLVWIVRRPGREAVSEGRVDAQLLTA
jgi:hypothetical protein